MLFFSNFFNFNTHLKKLEQQAEDVLCLKNGYKVFRSSKEIAIVDPIKNKIIQRLSNTFPSNPKRAILEITRQLNLDSEIKEDENELNKKSDVWTCGFRDNEARWVWYKNSEPKITVSFDEAYKSGSLEEKVFFFSARYGTSIISQIKQTTLENVAKEINAFILEHSYVKVACSNCKKEENYTIDDLVDSNRNPNYSSDSVVCQHCNELIKLL